MEVLLQDGQEVLDGEEVSHPVPLSALVVLEEHVVPLAGQYLEVFWVVVALVPIYVMHDLTGTQRATQPPGSDGAMLVVERLAIWIPTPLVVLPHGQLHDNVPATPG